MDNALDGINKRMVRILGLLVVEFYKFLKIRIMFVLKVLLMEI